MEQASRIRPYARNPFYWQYHGEPVLLLGGSVEDNLFQIPDIEAHLDLLASVGGNYVRCTLSSRDEDNVWPFERDARTGLYDLRQPGQEYWRRVKQFLALTHARQIIVQFEVWDRFDFARAPWLDNPYNPVNNVNYTAAESGLKPAIASHPGQRENAFFRSVPGLENNALLLDYQQAQVDWLLDLSLPYDHVLYCIDNETNESPQWGAYWAQRIVARARRAGIEAQVTEMWDDHDLSGPQHAETLDHPERYSFVDVSQNNHQAGYQHWAKPQEVRRRISESGCARPMNSVKIYGANTGRYGTTRDAQERMWRNVLGGVAASRFHRPPSGLGLSPIAQTHIRSLRMVTRFVDLFACAPSQDLLSDLSPNEAYCAADARGQFLVFFPDGGSVLVDVSQAAFRSLTVRWLDIRASAWSGSHTTPRPEGGKLRLTTPEEEGYWAAVVIASEGSPQKSPPCAP